jgi:uncharacterized protein
MAASAFIGLISDTHGLIRPEALQALHGSEVILHAGDIGGPDVLKCLEDIAPVLAVRSNNDKGAWAANLPARRIEAFKGLRILMVHDIRDVLEEDLADRKDFVRLVVTGHSHKAAIRRSGRVLFVNPGSAGPRRFRLPVTLARVRVIGGAARARIIPLLNRV